MAISNSILQVLMYNVGSKSLGHYPTIYYHIINYYIRENLFIYLLNKNIRYELIYQSIVISSAISIVATQLGVLHGNALLYYCCCILYTNRKGARGSIHMIIAAHMDAAQHSGYNQSLAIPGMLT